MDVAGQRAEALAAGLGDVDDFLEANPELARQIDAGLDAVHDARPQLDVVAAHDPRRLVDGQPEPVPGAVHEVLTVAGVGDHPARRRVDLRAGGAGLGRGHAGHHRGFDGRVDLAVALRRLADATHPGDVRHVAGEPAADVDHHGVAGLQRPWPGAVVRV